jgi:predicted nucleotidyltransferase
MAVQPIIDRREIVDETLIREISDRIVEHFSPKRIVVFGSHARGDARPESDLDLMVEMESDLDFYSRIPMITKIFGLRKWPLDLFVFTPAEVEKDRDVNGTLVNLIEREGKVLYAQK